MKLRAKGRPQEAFDDFGVGKIAPLGALAFCDVGIVRPRQRLHHQPTERDCSKNACSNRKASRAQLFTITVAPTETR
jgi:hypothetical protein